MQNYEKPVISAIAEMESEQVFAKKSGNNSNNGRWGSGNPNSDNGGVNHGTWEGGGDNNQGNVTHDRNDNGNNGNGNN
jgi:hypothetical protein